MGEILVSVSAGVRVGYKDVSGDVGAAVTGESALGGACAALESRAGGDDLEYRTRLIDIAYRLVAPLELLGTAECREILLGILYRLKFSVE